MELSAAASRSTEKVRVIQGNGPVGSITDFWPVCASCHSLDRVSYHSLVGSVMTTDEAKALAEESEYDSEDPNDQGEFEKRPGKISDNLPAPYKNSAEAASVNGAAPPDLSLMVGPGFNARL